MTDLFANLASGALALFPLIQANLPAAAMMLALGSVVFGIAGCITLCYVVAKLSDK